MEEKAYGPVHVCLNIDAQCRLRYYGGNTRRQNIVPKIVQVQSSEAKDNDLNINQEYSNLKQMVKEAGLLERRPLRYYGLRTAGMAAMLVASFAVMVTGDDTWDHVVNAVILGFLFGQLSFVGHDLSHRQVFRRGIHNEIGGLGE